MKKEYESKAKAFDKALIFMGILFFCFLFFGFQQEENNINSIAMLMIIGFCFAITFWARPNI